MYIILLHYTLAAAFSFPLRKSIEQLLAIPRQNHYTNGVYVVTRKGRETKIEKNHWCLV